MAWAAVIGAGAALVGGAVAAKGSKDAAKSTAASNQAAIDAAKLDPRQEAMIYGEEGGTGGLLGQYQALGQKPQDPRLQQYGGANLDYLGNAPGDMSQIRDAAGGLLSGAGVPKVGATGQGPQAFMSGAGIKAPTQNNLNLADSYKNFISGDSAKNPYLTGAIQGAIGQSQQAFDRMQGDATKNLQGVLGGIRSNSVLAGQYGGSRQGIAEGRALGDFATEQQRAIQNFGDNNTAAGVTAQAAEFGRGQDRALSATQGLGAQQYGVASQNAGLAAAAEGANVDRTNNINADWARRNDAAQVQNQGAQMQGIGMGAGLLSGQLAGAYGAGQDQGNFDINRATQVNGLLQPYLTRQNNAPAMQPVYSNTAGAALGGAAAGLGLYNQFRQAQTPAPQAGGNVGITSVYGNQY
jgi:hypothetical protein